MAATHTVNEMTFIVTLHKDHHTFFMFNINILNRNAQQRA